MYKTVIVGVLIIAVQAAQIRLKLLEKTHYGVPNQDEEEVGPIVHDTGKDTDLHGL